ncbi:hypothetical protein FQA39_LY01230 [Lamprigera yunnana]|nr:hypothetical protein FQA39_LY01230 [Lamprigera yunnana]
MDLSQTDEDATNANSEGEDISSNRLSLLSDSDSEGLVKITDTENESSLADCTIPEEGKIDIEDHIVVSSEDDINSTTDYYDSVESDSLSSKNESAETEHSSEDDSLSQEVALTESEKLSETEIEDLTEIQETELIEEPEMSQQSELMDEPEVLKRSIPINELKVMQQSEPIKESEVLPQSEPVQESQVVQQSELKEEPVLLQKLELIQKPEVSQELQLKEVMQQSELREESEVLQRVELKEEPTVLQQSKVIYEPEVLQQSGLKEVPQMLQQSKLKEESEVLQQSEIIEGPKVLQKSELIVGPKMLQQSEIIEQPEVLQHSAIIDEPEVLQQSEIIEESVVLQQSEFKDLPEVLLQSETIEGPKVLQQSEIIEGPKMLQQSELMDEPEVLKRSIPIKELKVMQQSEPIKEPEMLQQSELIEPPEMLQQSELKEQPEVLKQSESKEKPEVTQQSELIEKPEVLQQSEVVEEPEVLQQSEITDESEVPKQPELKEKPEMLLQSELTEKQEVLEESELKEEPKVFQKSELIGESKTLQQSELIEEPKVLQQSELIEKSEVLQESAIEEIEESDCVSEESVLETSPLKLPESETTHIQEIKCIQTDSKNVPETELVEASETLHQPDSALEESASIASDLKQLETISDDVLVSESVLWVAKEIETIKKRSLSEAETQIDITMATQKETIEAQKETTQVEKEITPKVEKDTTLKAEKGTSKPEKETIPKAEKETTPIAEKETTLIAEMKTTPKTEKETTPKAEKEKTTEVMSESQLQTETSENDIPDNLSSSVVEIHEVTSKENKNVEIDKKKMEESSEAVNKDNENLPKENVKEKLLKLTVPETKSFEEEPAATTELHPDKSILLNEMNETHVNETSSITIESSLDEESQNEMLNDNTNDISSATEISSADEDNSMGSDKCLEKSPEVIDCDDSIDQPSTSVEENVAMSLDERNDVNVIEGIMPTCNNLDPTNSEDENSENPSFLHVDTSVEKDSNDKNSESALQELQPQEDPIASDNIISVSVDNSSKERTDPKLGGQIDNAQGSSEELCIIPDTERVISQAEKDAAASMVPLRDPIDLEMLFNDPSSESLPGDSLTEKKNTANPENYVVSLCTGENVNSCLQCYLPRKSKYSVLHNKLTTFICDDGCLNNLKHRFGDKIVMAEGDLRVKKLTSGINQDNMSAQVKFCRKCSECKKKLTAANEITLSWETMEFCTELCLSKYQEKIASNCSNCQIVVRNNCLGKYCVRFGYDIRQFCSSICLEEFKKGLKVCSYCQKDMSSGGGDGFLAPVGDKGQFKDFCSKLCMEKYDIMSNKSKRLARKVGAKCSVCSKEKLITIEFELANKMNLFCGEPCFVAFKFVNNITPAKCTMCKRYFDNKVLESNSMFYDNALHSFCSKSCQNIYIVGHRKIVPCDWCKVKKYNFDMIKRYMPNASSLLMCSLNCLSLYQVSVSAVQHKKTNCHHCRKSLEPLYHLTMSDSTVRNFCSYPCVMAFQNQFPESPITLSESEENVVPVPTGGPKRTRRTLSAKEVETVSTESPKIPVISSVQSLASTNGPTTSVKSKVKMNSSEPSPPQSAPTVKTQVKHFFIIKPAPIPPQRNIGTLCKINMKSKEVDAKPSTCEKEVQTDEVQPKTAVVPIPVPIYVPTPMWMYSMPFPMPFPFPLPIPVPIFIPTTRKTSSSIMKELKKIQVKIPTDPFEAELLMMAEIVAGDKKREHTDTESDEEEAAPPPPEETTFSPEPVDASTSFGDDMLQMALKMATELDEPAVDLEGALTANTITASQSAEPAVVEPPPPPEEPQPIHHIMERPPPVRGKKRLGRPPKSETLSKRGRQQSTPVEVPIMAPPQPPPPLPPPPQEPVEKPDANMCLKYTFGVNAWKQWVTTKNEELEKMSHRVKLFKTEILQLTADELNYSLCLFVKEVRKPNGQEYAPDTIYYLCLGIQQYLFENDRIDNIFCDSYYEKFTDCLDEVARKFSILYNDSHYIVTRVEEEHLWESKQLGAHSPHVLLSTLMFFNTKHFNLTNVDEHMQLSFSHIMKHWKRSPSVVPGTSKLAGSRNVLLRFYPPQSHLSDMSQRKKKVYEQHENEDNPLRCPVKLYEFYLSKCPESVKTRNDVFYLLPERSCVPDSPVWYSTMPLPRSVLEKMLHRVKMVKEINVALLAS